MTIDKPVLFLYLVNAVILFALTYLASSLSDQDILKAVLLDCCVALYCFVFLAIQYTFLLKKYSELKLANDKAEKEVLEQVAKESFKQYELLKENMEIINIKCHDLRKQLRLYKQNDINNDDNFKDMVNAINIYDCAMKTGNEALDVILSEAAIRCQKNKIKLSCLADGKTLSFMSLPDIYSLFGNAVDNAIEYLLKVSEDKRFIRLQLKRRGVFMLVHIENYFEDKLEMENGLPKSSKNDEYNHGFGIKSMIRIVDKYSGNLKINTSNNLFYIDICIPLPKQEK